MKRTKEFREAATNLLDEAGIEYVVERGRHMKIRWTFEGHHKLCVVPFSSSDVNAIHTIRAHMRRQLRQDGVLQ